VANVSQGTYAGLPGSPATGEIYFFTDSVYPFARCDGAATWTYFLNGKIAVPPGPKSGWTSVNAGSELTITDGAGTIDLLITSNAATNLRGISKTASFSSAIFYYRCTAGEQNSYLVGVGFTDGTKYKTIGFLIQSGAFTLEIRDWSNTTTTPSTVSVQPLFLGGPYMSSGMYFRLTNDSATLGFDYSLDGITYHSAGTEAVGTFLTPTGYFVGGENADTGTATKYLVVSLQSVTVV
jgi:hypothetical protein